MKYAKYATIVPLIGGMTIGNKMATGTDPECLISYDAFDKNDSYCKHYFSSVPYLIIDDKTNTWKKPTKGKPNLNSELQRLEVENLDFVSTVCPCAGLSLMTPWKQSVSLNEDNATQNDWMYKTANFVLEHLKPKVFFGENAPGLYTNLGKNVLNNLREIAQDYGYTFSIFKTSTLFHGIPQKRERTFYFFWKGNKTPVFNYYNRSRKNLSEYLKDIPKDALYQYELPSTSYDYNNPFLGFFKFKYGNNWREESKKVSSLSNAFVKSDELLQEALVWIKENKKDYSEYIINKFENFVHKIVRKKQIKKNWWDLTPRFVSEYVTSLIARYLQVGIVHPTEERFLNLRECMYLMGFPHDFELLEVNSSLNKIITQNVPTNTARDVTLEVIKFLNGELKLLDTNFVKQNNIKQTIDFPSKKKKIKTINLLKYQFQK